MFFRDLLIVDSTYVSRLHQTSSKVNNVGHNSPQKNANKYFNSSVLRVGDAGGI